MMNQCYQGYHKRQPQKAKIEEELMPTAWHPSRWWIGVFCVPKKCWA